MIRRALPRVALVALLALAAAGSVAAVDTGKRLGKTESPAAARAEADAALLARDIAGLAPQRPGHADLFVLGLAGDGSEQVFRNEVLYLRDLAARRLDAAGHVLVLANHPDQPPQRPLPRASLANLRTALAGVGAAMDREQDLLLLYLTTHGTEDHQLLLRRPGAEDDLMDAAQIRAALDDAGIRHRVLAISACYSGGLIQDLENADTLVLTAARHDRTSFGCGNDSVATFFGRAWLVEGLNASVDFSDAFQRARLDIARREKIEALRPSRPQMARGERIEPRLAAWRASFSPGPALPYPYADPEEADAATGAARFTAPRLPGGTSR
ncbi:MAG: peptidase C13 [Arenimonas sp.]|nr:peptidase C13 [Arenimonas sp.]